MLVNEIVNKIETQGYDDFMKNYRDLEYQASWAGYSTAKRPRRTNGLISTYDLFDELGLNSEMVVNDVDKFVDEYGDLEILEDHYDNTYNYNGYLDHYVEFHYFELEDQVLVTLSVGLGLDPRSAYTKNVAMVFESEYDFLETLSTDFQLLDFEFTDLYGKKFYGSFDAEALSDFGYLSITDQETGENVYYDETIMDAGDVDDIKDTVEEILETDKISIDKINYFWYAGQ